MNRREFNRTSAITLISLNALMWVDAKALSLADLSGLEATRGLKAALDRGARAAVEQLGRPDGFLANERVRIPLPAAMERATDMLRMFGQGQRLDELIVTMNHAAEAAVPQSIGLLVDAVSSMTVDDAKRILQGGDTSATDFFADKTRVPLGQKFLPVVTRATEKIGLAEKYNQLAGRVADLGLIQREDASIEQHVTTRALTGLYLMMGEEEKKIRTDPVATGSALLGKVFGILK